jgi:hypothetical protein
VPDGKGKPNRGGSKTSRFRIARARRGKEALELRLAGLSYADIGDRMGVSSPRAFQLVSDELARLNEKRAETAEAVTRIELERLDRLLATVWEKAEAGDLAAIDRVLAIQQRRARLLGLDAEKAPPPAGGTVTLNITELLVTNNLNPEKENGSILENREAPPGPTELLEQ